MTCIGELTCIPPHGNSPESMCSRCEDAAIEARDKRKKAVSEALGRFVAAVEGVRWSDDQTRILESLIKAVTVRFKLTDGSFADSCLLCGWTDGCKPGCAAEAITGLLD